MHWITLHNKLGRQPIRNLRDKHAVAIIDDKYVFLDLKFKPDGTPYFVKAEGKQKKFQIGDAVYNKRTCQHEIVTEFTPDINQVFVTYASPGERPNVKHLVSIKDLVPEADVTC